MANCRYDLYIPFKHTYIRTYALANKTYFQYENLYIISFRYYKYNNNGNLST